MGERVQKKEGVAYSKEGHVKDHEVQQHAESDGTGEVHVLPKWELEQALVLRERIHGVEHFHCHQDREAHGSRAARHGVREHFTADFRELRCTFMEMCLGKTKRIHTSVMTEL